MSVWMVIIIVSICFIPVMLIFALLPYIGRRTLTFGVSIPSKAFDNDTLRLLRRTFALRIVIIGVIAYAANVLALIYADTELATTLLFVLVLVYIGAIYAMYLRKNKQTKQIKAQNGWKDTAQATVVADTRFASAKRSVSALWFLVYIIIIAGTLLLGILLYDQVPEKVPMHIDFEGNVTRVVDKTFSVILFAPVIQAFMALIFGFIYWMMLRTPPVIDPDRPEESSLQNAKFHYRWSAFMVFGGIVMLLVFACMQLSFSNMMPLNSFGHVTIAGAGALVIGAIILSITTGQSGSRICSDKSANGKVIRRDDDRYWKGGAIYVNKDDTSLFVEKRFGIGFTLNFGHPGAFWILGGFILLVVAIIIISFALTS